MNLQGGADGWHDEDLDFGSADDLGLAGDPAGASNSWSGDELDHIASPAADAAPEAPAGGSRGNEAEASKGRPEPRPQETARKASSASQVGIILQESAVTGCPDHVWKTGLDRLPL